MEIIRCPKCNSEEVSEPRRSPTAFVVAILLLGFPLPFIPKTIYHCFDCGYDFKKREVKKA